MNLLAAAYEGERFPILSYIHKAGQDKQISTLWRCGRRKTSIFDFASSSKSTDSSYTKEISKLRFNRKKIDSQLVVVTCKNKSSSIGSMIFGSSSSQAEYNLNENQFSDLSNLQQSYDLFCKIIASSREKGDLNAVESWYA